MTSLSVLVIDDDICDFGFSFNHWNQIIYQTFDFDHLYIFDNFIFKNDVLWILNYCKYLFCLPL